MDLDEKRRILEANLRLASENERLKEDVEVGRRQYAEAAHDLERLKALVVDVKLALEQYRYNAAYDLIIRRIVEDTVHGK